MIKYSLVFYIYLVCISHVSVAEEIGAKALFEGDGTSIALSKEDDEGEDTPQTRVKSRKRTIDGNNPENIYNSRKPKGQVQLAKSEGIKHAGSRKSQGTIVNSYGGIKYWVELDNGNGLRKVTTKHQFKSGDRIKIKLIPNIGGYLSVYNRGTTGKTNQLYPASGEIVGRVMAKQEYTVPSAGMIRFDNNPGREEIGIFLSQTPIISGNYDSDASYQRMPVTSYNDYSAAVPVSYTGCVGGKDLVPDIQCVGSQTGSKDLVLEEDHVSAMPAEYAVAPINDLRGGKSVSLSFTLKHN